MDSLNKSIRRTLLKLGGAAAPTDGELLTRFVASQEHAAFEALVQRHGPMVLRVCRRVLHHDQDAEDAFQAVFIVLARKAAAVATMASVGGWLHGVAFRTALHAKKQRGCRPVTMAGEPGPRVLEDRASQAADPGELRAALDEAVQHLPEKYRAPIVLCYLEGKTNAEAAGALCCSVPTIERRLSWARNSLRGRLARRGLALPAGTLAALLAQEGQAAVIPAAFVANACRMAGSAAGDGAAITPATQELADATLKAMGTTKWKIAAAVLAVVAALAVGLVGLISYSRVPPSAQAEQRNSPLPAWRLDRSIPVADLFDMYLSPDGRTCVSTSADHTVRLWDSATGRQKATLAVQGAFARFSPDGRWLALTDIKTGTAHIVEAASAKKMWSLPPPRGTINTMFVAAIPAMVVFDGPESERQATVYDVPTGKVLHSYRLPAELKSMTASSCNWARLSSSGQVKVHDLLTGKELASLSCPGVQSLGLMPNGEMMFGLGLPGSAGITVWHVPALKELGRYQSRDEYVDFSVAPDGRWLAVGRRDCMVELLETETGKQLWRKKRPPGLFAFSPDGNWLVSTGQKWSKEPVPAEDFRIEIWERKSGQLVLSLPAPKIPALQGTPAFASGMQVHRFAFSEDCRTMSVGTDGGIQVWRLDRNP
jgi:RNA polymerase sigma factor (sigma-70 family)